MQPRANRLNYGVLLWDTVPHCILSRIQGQIWKSYRLMTLKGQGS